MAGRNRIRTDLALEATERFKEENVEVHGVEVREKYDKEKDVRTTVVRITTENGAKTMGKPQGTYITIEAPDLSVPDEDYHREISEEVAHHLKELIDFSQQQSVLVVGLGNQDITADSLGPRGSGKYSYDKACDPGVWSEILFSYENAPDQRNCSRCDGADWNGDTGDCPGGCSRDKTGCGDCD